MRLLGFEIRRSQGAVVEKQAASPVYGSGFGGGTFWGFVQESFAGAWQSFRVDSRQNILAFSAVYACVSMISDDIAKLRPKLIEETPDGVWAEVQRNSPFWAPLEKPNRYQTRIQFISQWITSKLLYGNAYIYIERDARTVGTALYVLDPRRVVPLVADDGSVYYRLSADYVASVAQDMVVPASEIIHDRCITPFHPLIGVSPIYACGLSATQGLRIQTNSARFFENMSRPSGQLTAPGKISDETASRLKREFEQNFSAGNMGRLFVAGDGLAYSPMTIPAADAQLIQQMQWTVEDVARCFHVPPFKIAQTDNPRIPNIMVLNQEYYSQTLQLLIEAVELLLEEGLGMVGKYSVEFDLDGLLRMDPSARATANQVAIGAGYLTPNEARLKENLPPLEGGETAYMQQQMWPLAQLAERPLPAGGIPPAPLPAPAAPVALPPAPADDQPPTDVPEEPARALQGVVERAVADLAQRIEAQSRAAASEMIDRCSRTDAAVADIAAAVAAQSVIDSAAITAQVTESVVASLRAASAKESEMREAQADIEAKRAIAKIARAFEHDGLDA